VGHRGREKRACQTGQWPWNDTVRAEGNQGERSPRCTELSGWLAVPCNRSGQCRRRSGEQLVAPTPGPQINRESCGMLFSAMVASCWGTPFRRSCSTSTVPLPPAAPASWVPQRCRSSRCNRRPGSGGRRSARRLASRGGRETVPREKTIPAGRPVCTAQRSGGQRSGTEPVGSSPGALAR